MKESEYLAVLNLSKLRAAVTIIGTTVFESNAHWECRREALMQLGVITDALEAFVGGRIEGDE